METKFLKKKEIFLFTYKWLGKQMLSHVLPKILSMTLT